MGVTALHGHGQAKVPSKMGRCSQDLASRMPTLRDYGNVYHSFEKAREILNVLDFHGVFLKAKAFLPKVYEIFSEWYPPRS